MNWLRLQHWSPGLPGVVEGTPMQASDRRLSADLDSPDWPALTDAEVNEVLAAYSSLAGETRVRWRSPRPWSAAALVDTRSEPWPSVFIKRHHVAVRTCTQLAEEHRFMDHLRAASLPVATVLRADDGRSCVDRDSWVYEVHSVPEGLDCYRQTASWEPFTSAGHARSAGGALADLHQAAAGFAQPARTTELLVSRFELFADPDPLARMAEFVARQPVLARFLAGRDWRSEVAATLLPFHGALLPLLDGLPSSWAHNDWHASNLLWDAPGPEGQVSGIIDFGLADRTNVVYDVATALERNVIAWLDLTGDNLAIARIDLADAFLDGYWSRRTWDDQEAALLPAILPLVHVELALSEVAYYAGVAGRPDTARVAYEQFLLGHAAWFRTGPGRALLAGLASWRDRLR